MNSIFLTTKTAGLVEAQRLACTSATSPLVKNLGFHRIIFRFLGFYRFGGFEKVF